MHVPSQETLKAVHSDLLHLFSNCQELVKFGSGRGQREAYVTFADLLMVFAKQLRKVSHLASLVYVPDEVLQETLQVHLSLSPLSPSLSLSLSVCLSLSLSVFLSHSLTSSLSLSFSPFPLCPFLDSSDHTFSHIPQEYILNNVLQSDDDDDENEPTSEEEALRMAERLNDRRVLLASFLKLAMFSVIDNKMVAPIWASYIRVSVSWTNMESFSS